MTPREPFNATVVVMTRKLLLLTLFITTAGAVYLAQLRWPELVSVRFFQTVASVALLYGILAVGIEEIFVRRLSDSKARYSVRKALSLFLIFAVLVIWLRIWVPNPQALLVAYGVVAAGIAVALQDLIKNLAGSISVLLSGSFHVGNRIEINGVIGDVIDISLFHTTLLEVGGWIDADQATGRITVVPNGIVLSQPVQNYTRHHKYLWDEISVTVTSESDWGEAMRLMSEIGLEHTQAFIAAADTSLTHLERYYYVEGRVLDPNVYVKFDQNGYQLTLRYVVDAWQRRSTSSGIIGHIIRVFDEHDCIAIAPNSLASVPYPFPEHH